MSQELVDALTSWKTTQTGVEMEKYADDGELIELTWTRPAGDTGYIDLFPEPGEVIVAQHGMFADPQERQQCGVSRFRRSDLPTHLNSVKSMVDNFSGQPQKLRYSPSVEIGSVASLKLR